MSAFALTLLATACAGPALPTRDSVVARWCISAFERSSNQVATDAMLTAFTPQAVQDARHELSAAGRQPSTVEIVRNICRQQNIASST